MRTGFVFLTIILVICNSCFVKTNEKKCIEGVEVIPVGSALNNNKTIYLSSITDDIEYIKLETNDSCIIDGIRKMLFVDSLIFICTKKHLFMFDHHGSFISKIGQLGRGPGEYNKIVDFSVSQRNNTVAIYDGELKKVIFYDFLGRFLGNIAVTTYPRRIAIIDDYLLEAMVFPEYFYNDFYSLMFIDFHGNLKERGLSRGLGIVNEKNVGSIPSTNCVRLDYFNDTLTFWETHLNTVYKISTSNKIQPRYFLDYVNDNYQTSIANFSVRNSDAVRFGDFIELEKHIFLLKGIYRNELKHIVYEKKSKRAYNLVFKHEDKNFNIRAGFYNDIDGGYPFLPRGAISKNRAYCYFYPYILNKKLETDPFKSINYKDKNKRKELDALLRQSHILDNPIIMIITM
jgi:hypothetical protein